MKIGAPNKITAAQAESMWLLRKLGLCEREIGQLFGYHRSAVRYHLQGRAKNLSKPTPSELSTTLRRLADEIDASNDVSTAKP